jgi:hypothetical protein
MKILYLCNKEYYLKKMSRVRFHGIRALESFGDVKWSGPNWDNYNNTLTVQENIDTIYTNESPPQIVIAYKPLELKNYSEIKAIRCVRYNEMYNVEKVTNEILESKSNLVICHHHDDYVEYQARFKDFEKWPLNFVNIPHSAEESVFNNYNFPKTIDLLLVGSIYHKSILGDHYPLRIRMVDILKKISREHGLKCAISPHPGSRHNDAHTDTYAKKFAYAINTAKICITCSGVPRSRFGKYVEIPMCQTAIAADMPNEQQEDFKKFLIEIDMKMTDEEIIDKLLYYINNDEERESLIHRGVEYAKEYTQEKYAQRFTKAVIQLYGMEMAHGRASPANLEKFGMKEQPVIIGGCHGAGTSFLAKILRHNGLFLGADAGKLTDRKTHESKIFKNCNIQLFRHYANTRSAKVDPEIVKLHKSFDAPQLLNEASRNVGSALHLLFNDFWGKNDRTVKWGWKDPRNSISLPVWRTLFPDAKILILQKKMTKSRSKSGSGDWFKQHSSAFARSYYMNPPTIDTQDKNTKVVEFERMAKERTYLNEIFEWIGLPLLENEEEFQMFFEKVSFEGSI